MVLYLRTLEEVRQTAADLERAGVPTVRSTNPYRARWGQTVLNPNGNAVVIAAVAPEPITAGPVEVQRYSGSREELRGPFELAEDSPPSWTPTSTPGVCSSRSPERTSSGTCSLVDTAQPGHCETKKTWRCARTCRAAGSAPILVRAAVDLLTAESARLLAVATAAADVGNLRFYQRQGFRSRSVERDAFCPATGYPPGIAVDGIELRDRVGLDRPVPGELPR